MDNRTAADVEEQEMRAPAGDGDDDDAAVGDGAGAWREKKWKRCELIVTSCEPASTRALERWTRLFDRGVEKAHKQPRLPPQSSSRGEETNNVWEVRCELVTGRRGKGPFSRSFAFDLRL